MPAFPTNIPVSPFNLSVNYKKDDIVLFNAEYYYATQSVVGKLPTDSLSVGLSTYERANGLVTVNLASSATTPFAQGSFIEIAAPNIGFTGCCRDGGANFVRYTNHGPDTTSPQSVSGNTLIATLNPAWTTGFGWIPSYQTNLDTDLAVVEAKYGDGYAQRSRNGINNISSKVSLKFEKRTSKEVIAISNYVENAGGVSPVKVDLGDGILNGKVSRKFYLENPKITPESYNVNSLSVNAIQCYLP